MDYNFKLMLIDDFVIKRATRTPDGYGGYTTVYNPVVTVKGRLDDETETDQIAAGQDIDSTKYRLFVEPGTNILRDDRVEGKGRVLNVLYLATVYEEHPLEVVCEEAKPRGVT